MTKKFVVQNDPTAQTFEKLKFQPSKTIQYLVLKFFIVFCDKIQCRCMYLICYLTINCTEPHTQVG